MNTATQLREAALTMERIDTHAHLVDVYPDLKTDVAAYGHFEITPHVIDSRVKAEGCRVLYGIDPGSHLRPDAPAGLFDAAAALRKQGAWQAIGHALDAARISRQLAFCNHKPAGTRPFAGTPLRQRLAYLAYVDEAINGHGEYPCPDFAVPGFTYYQGLCDGLGALSSMNDYLAALDATIDGWRAHGVVGMKAAIAYTSGLAISDPPLAEARTAFGRKNDMTAADFRSMHDYAFRHCLLACKRNTLPVVIHTGFQVWGHSALGQSNPMLLHNLLADRRYRDITFVLLHGGNPYVGETTYLAGMFPNVFIDFTWIGWMTPARFRPALAEWLAAVPHDRMCWGSDSGNPESIAGINSIVRRLIADVLESCMADGTIDEHYAMEFLENTYVNTPARLFGPA